MVEMSLSIDSLKTMCRLCLSSGGTVDIFQFSTRMKNRVADVIMKCAPVQIEKCDEFPKLICPSCFTKLKKNHQFQMQVVQSEKTLRYYLQQINASDEQMKTERSENFFILDTNKDITMKSLIPTGCANDTIETFYNGDERNDIVDSKLIKHVDVNLKEKEPATDDSEKKVKEEPTFSFEVKAEPIDDYSVISRECADDTIETLYKDCDIETTRKDTKIDIDHKWDNFEGHCSADVTADFEKRSEDSKNISANIGIDKKASKIEYKCDFCNKCFPYSSGLCNHMRVHTGEKPYQCDVCSKCFARSTDIIIHKRTHTGNKPHRCDVCNRHFSRLQHLKSHVRIHTGEKPYRCDVCDKCFTRSTDLSTHKRAHTDEKQYQCNICSKSFNVLGYLKKHMRTHSGEKPYQCDVCNKQFIQSQHLKIHKRTHTGEKPYQCDVCNKCFARSTDLTVHKRTHTGEKPYRCDVCNRHFSQSQHLKGHELTHTGEKPYRCDVCNKRFTRSTDLNTHKRTHTKEKP